MTKAFPDHKIVTLEEMKEGGAKEIVTPEPTLKTCKLHEEKMKLFCFDCGCLICRDCTIKDHHSHNYEFVKKAAAEIKKKLSQHLVPLKEVKKDLLSAVKEVQTTKSKLEAKEQSMVGGVEKWCDELCQIIQQHKNELIAEVKNNITQKSGRLTGQEEHLSISCAVSDSVIEFTQHSMEHSTDAEIVCMYAGLKIQIDRELEEHRKKSLEEEPVEKDDVVLEVGGTEELKQLCQAKARITQIPLTASAERVSRTSDCVSPDFLSSHTPPKSSGRKRRSRVCSCPQRSASPMGENRDLSPESPKPFGRKGRSRGVCSSPQRSDSPMGEHRDLSPESPRPVRRKGRSRVCSSPQRSASPMGENRDLSPESPRPVRHKGCSRVCSSPQRSDSPMGEHRDLSPESPRPVRHKGRSRVCSSPQRSDSPIVEHRDLSPESPRPVSKAQYNRSIMAGRVRSKTKMSDPCVRMSVH